ncbi:MAG: 4-hydroxythreonine-4-phosphate dehydrogenase PdxA [Candidatus Omnitrophica bacterium]|nr:4-hydroxythreonine-4-phosphate dehydrogenase PdxA [Candidatus Omnitrophota bacterium]
MLRSKSKIIGITLGDPAGIGPEVTAAALLKARAMKGVEFVLIGNEASFRRYWPRKKDLPTFLHISGHGSLTHAPGRPTAESGHDSLLYLAKAVELLKSGRVHGLVTAPVSKESVSHFHKGFKGHTTFLAQAFGLKNVEMVFVAGDMKLVLVTRHVAIRELPRLVTKEKVLGVLQATNDFLVDRFGIKRPRIAVLGLNPHAGEGGQMGDEEIKEIIPAMKKAAALGMDVLGPFPADTLFEPRNCRGYDLIAAMYHDQGLIALKTLYFDRLVNLTVGLPFIRTSPAHGTAFGIAGQGLADPGSMKASIDLAVRLTVSI